MENILKCCCNNIKNNSYKKCNCYIAYLYNKNEEICAIQYKKINNELTLSLESNNGKYIIANKLTLYMFPYSDSNYCIIKENLNFTSIKDIADFIFIEYDRIVNNLIFQ